MAILLQDHHGGLQCKYGDDWLDVKPVPGALVVNIGDVFQVTNLVTTFQILNFLKVGLGKIGFGSSSDQPDQILGWSGLIKIHPNSTELIIRSAPNYIRIGSG